MKRIASGSQSATAPVSYGADSGTPGYFVDAATSPTGSPTQLTPKWCNMVQEAVVQTIEGSGAALADTLSQFATVVVGVHGISSHATDTTNLATPKKNVVLATGRASSTNGAACIAGNLGYASADYAVVLGGTGCSASASRAVAGAGSNKVASATGALALGGTNGTASGVSSASLGGDDNAASGEASACVGGSDCNATAEAAGTYSCVNVDATGLRAAALCAGNGTASGAGALLAACSGSTAAGDESVIAGGYDHDITSGGDYSAVLAGRENRVDVPNSVILGGEFNRVREGDSSLIAASQGCHTAGAYYGRALLASKNACLVSSDTTGGNGAWIVGGGYSVSTLTGTETANTAITWAIDSQNGWGHFLGGVTTNDPSADVAEYHENASDEPVPVGCLVANVGRKVKLAAPGDGVFGVVSATPGVALGASQLGWSGQYERDEWGREVWVDVPCVRWSRTMGEDYDGKPCITRESYDGPESAAEAIPADAVRYVLRDRVRAAGYDPARGYTPRAQRPAEWTPVAKLGLVRVRVASGVKVGDMLAPGKGGVAAATDKPKGRRTAEVLEILSAFDAGRGYAIALCDLS